MPYSIHPIPDHIKTRARQLRKNSTESKKIMRNILRNRQLDGHKRYRQFPICIGSNGDYRRFFADFYSYDCNLLLEIDGWYHETLEQKIYDTMRSEMIAEYNIKILRI